MRLLIAKDGVDNNAGNERGYSSTDKKKKKGYLSRLSVQGRELSKEKKKSQIRIKHTT